MSEVRCPMCGKPNPEDNDVCQFCQARIKPLIISSQADETPPEASAEPAPQQSGEPGDDDWLSDLRASPDDEESIYEPDEDLSRIEPFMDVSSQVGDAEDVSPDWLGDMRTQSGAGFDGPGTQEAEGDAPNWLQSIRSQGASEIEDILSRESGEIEDRAVDFGNDFGFGQELVEPSLQPSSSESELLGWLTRTDDGGETQPEERVPAESIPTEPTEEVAPEAAEPAAPGSFKLGDKLPDWLSGEEDAPLAETPAGIELEPGDSAEDDSKRHRTGSGMLDFLMGDNSASQVEESVEPAEEAAAEPAAPGSFDLGDELPDWLAGEEDAPLVETPTALEIEEPAAPVPTEAEKDELPDWLAGVDGEADMPDWLSQGEAIPEVEEPATLVPSDAASGAGLPDWWAGAQGEGAPEVEELAVPDPADVAEVELPGWLADGDRDEELPDWLSQGEAAPEVEEPAAPISEDSEADPFDWMSSAEDTPQAEAPAVPEPGDDSEDEITRHRTGTGMLDFLASDDTAPQAEEPVEPKEGIPDWLADVEDGVVEPDLLSQEETAAVVEESETPAVHKPEYELPTWLAGLDDGSEPPDWVSDEEAAPRVEEFAAPALGDAEDALPDWLAGAGAEVPDWLSQEGVVSQAEEPVPVAPDETEDEPEVPDSKAGLGVVLPAAAAAAVAAAVTPPDAVEKSDEWATFFADDGSSEAADEERPIEDSEVVDGDLDWLDELESTYPEIPVESTEAGGVSPFAADEPDREGLPTWLAGGAALAEGADEPEQAQTEEDAELTPAELPSWLEAMRPIDAVSAPISAIGGEAGPVEGAGPLAGLRGVLPAEPDVSRAKKPAAYSVKLKVSDVQRSRAELLVKLLETEGAAKPVPGQPIITSQRLLRYAIAILLLAATFLFLLPGVPQVSPPTFLPETFATSQLIGSVGNGSPVMLAVDYEPGLSGEMDATTAAVVDHLMIQGAPLTLVSITSTGPMQAERLVAIANQVGGHHYQSPGQYQNLGFIPGGPTGLRSFAENPQGTLPQDMDGNSAWQTVQSLSDYALIIVATGNPDTARSWVEQVQPTLTDTPFIMVASAQAEPMVQPYYQSGQIQGMVSGLSQGAAYENLLGREGNAHTYWTPFSIGILIAALLILIGGGINAVSVLMARSKEGGEGDVQS